VTNSLRAADPPQANPIGLRPWPTMSGSVATIAPPNPPPGKFAQRQLLLSARGDGRDASLVMVDSCPHYEVGNYPP
jgi:hypothetical protein